MGNKTQRKVVFFTSNIFAVCREYTSMGWEDFVVAKCQMGKSANQYIRGKTLELSLEIL
jgi:hypothetical protein